MAENYQHKDVAVRFDVFLDGKETAPDNASVAVYAPGKDFLGLYKPTIKQNEVSYVLEGDQVEKVGKYFFVFDVKVKGLGEYTHIIDVTVKELPVPVQEEEGVA